MDWRQLKRIYLTLSYQLQTPPTSPLLVIEYININNIELMHSCKESIYLLIEQYQLDVKQLG